tara:strand:+ start:5278 stop:5766 length:489 start_codon:yes stop_codon:yes gene_type:complete
MDKIDINYHMGTATFPIDMVAGGNKQTYKGMFKVKCILGPLEVIESDALYRKLLGDSNPNFASEYVGSLAYALSQLKYRIIDAPAWYKNDIKMDGSHVDDAILLSIFDVAVEAEEEYRKGIEEKYQKARNSVVEAIDDGTLNDGSPQQPEEEEEEKKDETED